MIWVLADDRAGNVSQCLGVAEALGLPFEIKKIRYNPWVKLPNLLRGASLLGVDAGQSDALAAPYPALVIAAGRRTAPVARAIKKRSGGNTKLVQIMWPGFPADDFDLIVVPSHDFNPSLPRLRLAMTVTGSPNRIAPAMLQVAKETWQDSFIHLPRPLIALIVGGNTKKHRFTPDYAAELGRKANALAQSAGGALLITTSRRTEAEATRAMLAAIACPYYLYDWTQGGENPYFGFLACADAVVVTGDSMSMCSEAATSGKPVYIFAPPPITSSKHARLHQELYRLGNAQALEGQGFIASHPPPFNVTEEVAREIKRRFL